VEPVKRSRLIEITFESHDPALAANVANSVANTYINENLEARWQASEKAAEWLTHQLSDMKTMLEKSQDVLQTYARQSGLLFLETEQGNTENLTVQKLRELQQDLTKAEAERYQYESFQRLLQQGDYASLPGVFDNKLMQDLTEKLADLKRERSRLAADFNPQYPRLKEIDDQIAESESDLAKERERGAQLIENNYKAAVDRESLLRDAFDKQKVEANQVADKSVQYNILKREADTNKQLYVGLLEKLKETAVSTSLRASNIRIVDVAHPPTKPDRPRIPLNLSLGGILGLFLGIACVFLQEHLDDTFKTAEEAEQFLRLPSLCSIPRAATTSRGPQLVSRGSSAKSELASEDQQISKYAALQFHAMDPVLAEAFHALRTSILLSRAKCPPGSLLLTSTQPGEGKTTIAVNLAISLAQLGHSVLLIDADLRRPMIGKCVGRQSSPGLVDFLTGQGDWRTYVWQSPVPRLSILASGIAPPNPADLLASDYMRTLIESANNEYRFVVLDSPPVTELADSRILATLVQGIVLVVGCGTAPRDLVQRAYNSGLDRSANVLGVAVNFTESKVGYGYYGYSRTESQT
jgi:capsular exopolysaccharide synthesis family protein